MPTRCFRGVSVFLGAIIGLGLLSTTASAQEPPPPPNGEPSAPSNAAPSNTPSATATNTAPSGAVSGSSGDPAAAAKAPETKWYDTINFGAFVDTYYSHNWRRPRPNTGANVYQPYTPNSGFGLAWVGLDASVDPDPVGATLQLRFGPSVPNLALGDFAIPGGIGFVQNGYVSWKPSGKDGKVTLILGKFDTVYGAEVAQSHLNMNYTRGFLYNLAQPFFHTGLRADIQATDLVGFKLLAVNGWNNTIDNNRGKSFGGQVVLTPNESLALSAGYMGGPEESDVSTVTCGSGEIFDSGACITPPAGVTGPSSGTALNTGADSRWRHLVDIVADLKPTKDFRIVANGDYVTQAVFDPTTGTDKAVSWFGAALLARYQLSDMWAAAVRGEVIRDKDGQISAPNTKPLTLYTGTLTLEAAPHKFLLIRLDNRIDAADEPVFLEGASGSQKTQFTTTLGVVAKTN